MLALALLAVVCQPGVAKAQVLAQSRLQPLRPIVQNGGGVDGVICHDLTGDGRVDMAFTVFSGGTAGDTAWVILRRTPTGWSVGFTNLAAYKVGVRRHGTVLDESQPVYKRKDPNCCPTGGFDHRRLQWNGRRFVVVRRWHDSTPS